MAMVGAAGTNVGAAAFIGGAVAKIEPATASGTASLGAVAKTEAATASGTVAAGGDPWSMLSPVCPKSAV